MTVNESKHIDDGNGAVAYLPDKLSLESLREAAANCRGCELYKSATQTVFGVGPAHARMMLVGEEPGDAEDKLGRPFVGPAGRVLQRAMDEAGISAHEVYLTNAVKHFKFVTRGKRRIHVKPRVIELRACRPWLDAEIEVVRPGLIVALGATAAHALLGASFRLSANRGQVISSSLSVPVVATVHPSSILRAPDDRARHDEMASFVEDLRAALAATSKVPEKAG